MSLITCDIGKGGFHWYNADSDTNGVIAKKDKNDFLILLLVFKTEYPKQSS